MRIVIDLDGVICTLRKQNETYEDVKPLPGAIEKISELKSKGHRIIIYTARHMLSTGGNVGSINRKVGKTTLEWLDKYGIEYDEIYFGKPYGDLYIDDSALLFKGWESFKTVHYDDKINLVIPMAGKGSRFLKAGMKTPKPLIEVKGKMLFEWALEGFIELIRTNEVNIIFIVLEEHEISHGISSIIKLKYPNAIIRVISKLTDGQAVTVLSVRDLIDNYRRLIIFNSDTLFLSKELPTIINNSYLDGAIACFKDNSEDSHYSFVLSDSDDYVLDIAEKKRISNNASIGLYYYSKGSHFVDSAIRMITLNNRINNEFYVMPTYEYLLGLGKRIKLFYCDEYHVLGTPDELKAFQKI